MSQSVSGSAASLARYFEARRRWPEVPMMMGIGNLTELTEVDTAGMNACWRNLQELRITSILTTEVINWARTAVKEFDVARRLANHALNRPDATQACRLITGHAQRSSSEQVW
ncbi:MAG: hypothetical protein R3B91_13685 [Planctomycetaceae bacterium]